MTVCTSYADSDNLSIHDGAENGFVALGETSSEGCESVVGRRKVVHSVQVHDMFSVGAMDIIVADDLPSGFRFDIGRRLVGCFDFDRIVDGIFSSTRLFCKSRMSCSTVELTLCLLI